MNRPSGARRRPAVDSGSEFDQFVRRIYADHEDQLLSFVLRLTAGDRHWAEDVVQETMLRAWRHARQLLGGPNESLMPWLSTVARRIVYNHLRARRARPQEVADVMIDITPQADDTDRAIQRMLLGEALRHLNPIHRDVVVELYVRGGSVAQVAERLNLPPGTVKSRAYYAMRALRRTLTAQGVSLNDHDR